MADPMQFPESDPRHHTAKLKQMLTEIMEHASEDVAKVTDPRAQALFETTAEVLAGLKKAYEQFEQGTEGAWKTVAGSRHLSQCRFSRPPITFDTRSAQA